MFSLFRSLLLSTLVSFALPILLLSGVLVGLYTASYIPGFAFIGQTGTTYIREFLAVFGSGHPFKGIFTISCTFAFVGSLFDLFNFSIYQGVRHNPSEKVGCFNKG